MKLQILILYLAAAFIPAGACTSAIISAALTDNHRPLLWKHRDTGADNNFLQKVEPTDSTFGYVGLFNAGDSLLSEAWMGMNDHGFAIMNTASYNLAPDTAAIQDREGVVMSLALKSCVTIEDFERLLGSLPKPMGIQANFGVIDAKGGGSYFEANDWTWTRYDMPADGYIIRTNFSVSGTVGEGYGHTRCHTADCLVTDRLKSEPISPYYLTDIVSSSYLNADTGRDYIAEYLSGGDSMIEYNDFIPRDISTSSIVIEGVNSVEQASDMQMWAKLGYPPCTWVGHVTLSSIPERFLPNASWRSSACDDAANLRKACLVKSGESNRLNLDILLPIIKDNSRWSRNEYFNHRYSK